VVVARWRKNAATAFTDQTSSNGHGHILLIFTGRSSNDTFQTQVTSSGITGPTGPGAKKPLTLKTFSGGEGNSQGGSGGQWFPLIRCTCFRSIPQEYLDLTKVNFGKTKKKGEKSRSS
jgi:hypothetical protein